ncbi:34346_t:CDS:2, partial [Racocetra persica]
DNWKQLNILNEDGIMQGTNGEERKEFILEEAHCKDCGKKLVLKDFNIKELRGV